MLLKLYSYCALGGWGLGGALWRLNLHAKIRDIPWIPPCAAFSSLVTPLFEPGPAALDSEGKVSGR